MAENLSEREVFMALDKEYRKYISEVRRNWLSRNQNQSKDVYEVMRPDEREKVHQTMSAYDRYITPIAEAWWKKRGWGCIWPEDNSKPMQVYKLETVPEQVVD